MINKSDISEITRRLTPDNNCLGRVALGFIDEAGNVCDVKTVFFSNQNKRSRQKLIDIARSVTQGKANEKLKDYQYKKSMIGKDSTWELLMRARKDELKTKSFTNLFYEIYGEKRKKGCKRIVYLFYGAYDIPRKAKDNTYIKDSDEVYQFLICADCPEGKSSPENGFIFPMYEDRSGDISKIAIYNKFATPASEITRWLLGL